MKYNLFILLSLLFIIKVEAQNLGHITSQETGFHLEVTIPTQKNKKIYLGQYLKGATYARDSVSLSDQGKAIFTSTEKLPGGQYFLYVPPHIQVDFLLDKDQSNVQLFIDESDPSKNNASGSNDTKLLWEYLSYIQTKTIEKNELDKELEDQTISPDKRTKLTTQLKKLEDNTQNYITNSIKQNSNNWFGIFLKGMEPIPLPYSPPKNEKEYVENKEYGKVHFFDNIALTDPRLWRTNYLTTYIDSYMQQWVDQIPDSLAAAASRLVAKTEGNDSCFQEMLSFLTNNAIKSNRMGDENIWARLVEDYIFDKNVAWIDSTQLFELRKMYEPIKYNRIGMMAQNLTLETIEGKAINTNDIQSDYLLLYFYDTTCGHCQKETPEVHNKLYKKYKNKGLEIVAINIGSDKKEWTKFIAENGLTNWLNCADPDYKSKYWMYYDTSHIPSTFVLDKNKIIVAKKIDEQNLEKFFDFYLQDKNGTN